MFTEQTMRRAKAVLEMAEGQLGRAAVGSGVDLLLDNLAELRSAGEARTLALAVRERWPVRCQACGSFHEAGQSCGCFDNGGQ